MKEMDELSSGIQRLKKNSEGQKRIIEQLEKDRAFLMERTRFLSQKLSEAYVIYEEAGKRILDFVDKETAPIKNQIAEIKGDVKRLSVLEQELKIHSVTIEKMKPLEHELKLRIAENEKAIKRINETAVTLRSYLDGLKESESRDEEAINSRVAEIKAHLENRLKTAEEKLSAKIAESSEEVIQDTSDSINVLSTSHEFLRKRISDGELAVRQLKVGTVDIRKQIENAGIARQDIEKRIATQHASLREAESAIVKMERRLNGINLEDDKLEKRLAELRRISHEEVTSRSEQLKSQLESGNRKQLELIDSRSGQMRIHIESQHKRQNESLDSRMAEFASQVQGRINTLSQRLSAREHAIEKEIVKLRRQAKLDSGVLADRLEKQAMRLEKMLKQEHAVFELEKSKVQKNLSDHLSSISGIRSSIEKIQKSLDSINLEDADLENRLAEVRKNAQEEMVSRISQLRNHVESSQKKTLENLDARIKALSADFHSRASGLNEKLIAENQRVSAGLQELATRFAKKMDDERTQDLRFEKRLAESLKAFEGSIDEKIARFRLHSDASQKKHSEALSSRLSLFSDEIDGRMDKLKVELNAENEKLKVYAENSAAKMSERLVAENMSLETRLQGKLDSKFSALAKRLDGIKLEDDKLEKRLSDLRKEQSELTDSRIASLSDEMDSKMDGVTERIAAEKVRSDKEIELLSSRISKSLDGIKLEDNKLEKRLAALRKSMQEEIAEKSAALKSEMALSQKGQMEKIESRFGSLSEDVDAKISGIREAATAEGQQLKARLDDSFAKISDRLLLEKSRSGKRLDDFENRVVKRLDAIKHSDDRFDERLSESLKAFEGIVDDKVAKLKSHADTSLKRHAELFDSRLSSLSQEIDSRAARMNERLDSESSRVQKEVALTVKELSKRMDGIKIEDGRFEKHLASSLREFEGAVDGKMNKFRITAEAERKDHLKVVDSMLGSLSERFDEKLEANVSRLSKRLDGIKLEDDSLEKRLSEAKRYAEGLVDSSHKKHLELLDNKMDVISGKLDAKFSAASEKIAAEKVKVRDVQSYVGKKVEESQKILATRISGIDSDFEKKLSQIYSHVTSERKSMADVRAALEREIREEQKVLSGKITGIADSTAGRLSGLSEEVATERKALTEERQRLSGRLADTNRALSVLSATMKFLESGLKETRAMASEKSKSVETEIDGRVSKLQVRLEADRKDIEQKLRIAESGIRTISAEISGLKKTLKDDTGTDASLKRRVLDMESGVKSLASSISGLQSSVKAINADMKRRLESVASSDAGLDKEIGKSQETIKQLIETNKASQEHSHKRIETLESAVRMLSEKLYKNEKAMEKHMNEVQGKLTKSEQSDIRSKELEIKGYVDSTLKTRYENDVARMRSEMARLKEEVAQWKDEQNKLYELLKEES